MHIPCLSSLSVVAGLMLAYPAVSDRDSAGPALAARSRQGSSSKWFVPPRASVFSEQKHLMPQHTTQAVELLRFVTAYKVGVEALVDVTPYSALLRSAADTDDELTFFAFIDTWVGNNTPEVKPVMSIDSAGTCTQTTKTQDAWGDGGRSGNGWQLDVDLVFWPPARTVDTRPRESITISSGYYGGYSIGSISFHEGKVAAGRKALEMKGGVDLTGTLDAEVYPCPGGMQDAQRGVKMGKMARRARSIGNSSRQLGSIIEEVYNQLVGDSMAFLTVANSSSERMEVDATFNTEEIRAALGMPVFYEKDDVQVKDGKGDFSFPHGQTVGTVVSVDGDKVTVKITGPCLPGNTSSLLPRLRIEKFPDALVAARKLADSMGTLNKRVAKLPAEEHAEDFIALLARGQGDVHRNHSLQDADASIFKPFLVMSRHGEYSPAPILANVDLGHHQKEGVECAPETLSLLQQDEHEAQRTQLPRFVFGGAISNGSPITAAQRLLAKAGKIENAGLAAMARQEMLQEGDKVCVLARRATGRVFERSFELPTFAPAAAAASAAAAANVAKAGAGGTGTGDRVLLQFAVTGHGWSGSTEQCGEFCHAIYHIRINGQLAMNVTEWRDDCERNPIDNQLGTWPIARDGWCPGSVEPGLYLDVTKWLKNGRNQIAVDLSVWSSTARQYLKYTNYGGFDGADGAMLFVGATLFVYDGAAVDAIRAQEKAYTAAEAALRVGCSVPKALEPPERVNSRFGDSLLQMHQTGFSKDKGKVSHRTRHRTSAAEKRHKVRAALAFHKEAGTWTNVSSSVLSPVTLRARSDLGSSSHADIKDGRLVAAEALQHNSFLSQQAGTTSKEDRYNFEGKAPWYLYSDEKDGALSGKWGANVVHAFVDGLIQINSREIRVKVKKESLPKEWGQAAVHLRLERPSKEGRTMDNWDRVGSFGLVFEENAATTKDPNSKVTLRPSPGRNLITSWKLL